jgi:signal recognition particle receptor subunit beta
MPHIDGRSGELVIRIVYDGAPEAGKTTNVQQLLGLISLQRRGAAKSPGTSGARTEFFDWLDFTGGYLDGRRVRCQLVSVPGQPKLLHRRKYLLETADAIVFVTDSRREAFEESIQNFSTTLRMVERATHRVPVGMILQANKQDMEDALLPADVARAIGVPATTSVVGSTASSGDGVMQTFVLAVRLATDRVRLLATEETLTDLPQQGEDPDALHSAMVQLDASVQVEDAPSEAERVEAERVEAERVEAARVEAARVEAERVEAERVEAERVEAARVEAARVEAERVEAERVEAARVEAARVEAARVEAERVAAERAEAARRREERIEAALREQERLDAARQEAERVEAAWGETLRIDQARREAAQRDADRLRAASDDTAVADALRADHESSRRDTVRYGLSPTQEDLEARIEEPRALRPSKPIVFAAAQPQTLVPPSRPSPSALARDAPVVVASEPVALPATMHPATSQRRNRIGPKDTLQLPQASEIASGHVWPPVKGRAAIAAATSTKLLVPDAVQAWAPVDASELVSEGGWVMHTTERWVYPSEPVARHRLLTLVRGLLPRVDALPEGRSFAIARDRDQWRLWVVTPVTQSLADAVAAAVDAKNASNLTRAVGHVRTALGKLGELGLSASAVPAGSAGLALIDGRLVMLALQEGEDGPTLEARDPLSDVAASLEAIAGEDAVVGGWLNSEGAELLRGERANTKDAS